MKQFLARLFKRGENAPESKEDSELDNLKSLLVYQDDTIRGMEYALGLAQRQFDQRNIQLNRIIGCLVSMMGNNVVINGDLVNAITQGDLLVYFDAVKGDPDGVSIRLLTREEHTALTKQEGPAND